LWDNVIFFPYGIYIIQVINVHYLYFIVNIFLDITEKNSYVTIVIHHDIIIVDTKKKLQFWKNKMYTYIFYVPTKKFISYSVLFLILLYLANIIYFTMRKEKRRMYK